MSNLKENWPRGLYILIPSYRSAEQLKQFFPLLLEEVPLEKICVVDDGSGDGTCQLCKDHGVACLVYAVNRGKGAVLSGGFSHLIENFNARWIITMDADGQHSPSDLPAFIETISRGDNPGICIGKRDFGVKVMPPARIISNKITSVLLSFITLRKITDSQCGFRLYSSEFIKSIDIHYSRFEMETEVIIKAAFNNFPILFVPVRTLYLKGPSYIAHLPDTYRWVKAVIRVWFSLR